MRLRELRERVADGGDPTKLHEPPTEQISDIDEQETGNSAQLFVNFYRSILLFRISVVHFLE